MPTYQYECESCGYAFDELQSMMDKKLRKCPDCGKFSLQRLIGSGAGIIFKGTGFYQTDYKKKEPVKAESSATEKVAAPATACSNNCACADKAAITT